MRRLALLSSLLLLSISSLTLAAESKFVEVKKPFINVYEYLEPGSTVLKQVKQGDILPLVYEGTSWFQVKVDEKVGWMEKRAGVVVDAPRLGAISLTPVTVIGFIMLLLVAGTIVFFVVYRQRANEAV